METSVNFIQKHKKDLIFGFLLVAVLFIYAAKVNDTTQNPSDPVASVK